MFDSNSLELKDKLRHASYEGSFLFRRQLRHTAIHVSTWPGRKTREADSRHHMGTAGALYWPIFTGFFWVEIMAMSLVLLYLGVRDPTH